jgi:hypothetical protein
MVSFMSRLLYAVEIVLSIRRVGGWMRHRIGLNAVERRKKSFLCRESNPDSAVQPVARRHTNWAHLIKIIRLGTRNHTIYWNCATIIAYQFNNGGYSIRWQELCSITNNIKMIKYRMKEWANYFVFTGRSDEKCIHNYSSKNFKENLSIYLWLYSPLLDLGRFSVSWSFTQSVGLLGREISPSQGRYLHTGQHKHRISAHKHSCLKRDSKPRSECSSERRQFMP